MYALVMVVWLTGHPQTPIARPVQLYEGNLAEKRCEAEFEIWKQRDQEDDSVLHAIGKCVEALPDEDKGT
jgi:hypothetical protein